MRYLVACIKDATGFRLISPEAFRSASRQWSDGRYVMEVRPAEKNRSLAQNAYLHAAVFPVIAEHVGCSVEDIKYDLMGEKWGWKESALDVRRMVPVKPSTSSMTVAECKEFIDWIIPFALDKFGIELLLPSEEAA